MKRKRNESDYFAMLLKAIYGRVNLKVEYSNLKGVNQKKTVIMFRGNEFYQDSYSHRKQEKYKHIFYLTFCAPEIYFVNENEKIIFERADAVSNAIDYLRSFDVNIPEYFCRERENKILCKAIYTSITEIILPMIFEFQNTRNKLDKQLDTIKAKLQAHFAGFELGYLDGINAVAKDYEMIYDSAYYDLCKIECFNDSYAVTIDREKVVGDIILPFSTSAVNIGVQRGSGNEKYTFESIIGNYQKYPLADDEPFIDPFIGQAENYVANSLEYTKESYFPLSNVMIPPQYFIPRYFYYITRINEDIIKKYNNEIKENLRCPITTNENGDIIVPLEDDVEREFEFKKLDHSKLDSLLMKRAAKDFREVHRQDISEYYHHVMMYIEDMIKRIATADYSFAIRRDSDVEACQNFTKHFNIDYTKIIEYIEDDNCIEKCYEIIESKIKDFASDLKLKTSRFANELKKYQSCGILSHYNNIGEYIDSGKLLRAIKIKKKKLSEPSSNDTEKNMLANIEKGSLTMWKTFDIMTQHENTYEHIYNALKIYHDNLRRVIEDERQS